MKMIGETTAEYKIDNGYVIDGEHLEKLWEEKLEPVFPTQVKKPDYEPKTYSYEAKERKSPAIKVAKPRVLIPVFPAPTANTTPRAHLKRQALRQTSS